MTSSAESAPAKAPAVIAGDGASRPWSIRIENVSKKYRLASSGRRELNENFRDALSSVAKGIFSRRSIPADSPLNSSTEFWALREINLEFAQGETVGIIGRNGAGKSTLLKILSRITAPTLGEIRYRGRLTSLLEVGTGFHRELTGRENVYLNGSILGMTRAEIRQQFDAIVEFAGVEKFIDSPVKHYSSGMYVRLAFAVAAHLRTDILVVDEVLAVGDAVFQKKCLGKMQDVASDGRTVLFVSHNMASIQGLCKSAVLLAQGRVAQLGSASDVIEAYLKLAVDDGRAVAAGDFDLTNRRNSYTPSEIIIRRMRLRGGDGRVTDHFRMGEDFSVEIECTGFKRFPDSVLGITIKSRDETWIGSFNTGMAGFSFGAGASGDEGWLRCSLKDVNLNAGTYSIALSILRDHRNRADYVDRAGSFHVVESDVYGTGYPMHTKFGIVYLKGKWESVVSD
ncbi:ABC transporter ATP-binding protein [Candidatus Sumerlaeota bacterium]|nr:ABC transporter ATP-binding protein [Candidatus Sumerlaeota bacterium]